MFNSDFLQNVRSTAKGPPLVDRLVNAITMIIMMGLTWIFGYFLLIPLDVTYEEAMQWLFTIFNVFQVGPTVYISLTMHFSTFDSK